GTAVGSFAVFSGPRAPAASGCAADDIRDLRPPVHADRLPRRAPAALDRGVGLLHGPGAADQRARTYSDAGYRPAVVRAGERRRTNNERRTNLVCVLSSAASCGGAAVPAMAGGGGA